LLLLSLVSSIALANEWLIASRCSADCIVGLTVLDSWCSPNASIPYYLCLMSAAAYIYASAFSGRTATTVLA
jgi:hypothetical protein